MTRSTSPWRLWLWYLSKKLVLTHLKKITGTLLDTLQFASRANRSVDGTAGMWLHYILHHLKLQGHTQRSCLWTLAWNSTRSSQNSSAPSSLCQPPPFSGSQTSWQKAATAGTTAENHFQHWYPPGMCALLSAILPLHKWMHLRRPVS